MVFARTGFIISAVFVVCISVFVVFNLFTGNVFGTAPLTVQSTNMDSSNLFGQGCTMTLEAQDGTVSTIQTYTGDCFDYPRGSYVFVVNGQIVD